MPKIAKPNLKKIKQSTEGHSPAEDQSELSMFHRAVYLDPGNRWTGVAIFEKDSSDDTWDCVDAFTVDAHDPDFLIKFEDWLWQRLSEGYFDIVGYEKYRLYEDKAQEQKGSEFEAVQLIGKVKFMVRRNGNRWPAPPVELVQFLPERKKPTQGILAKRGVTMESERRGQMKFGDHARDAEWQGYYDILHNRGWKIARKAPDTRMGSQGEAVAQGQD